MSHSSTNGHQSNVKDDQNNNSSHRGHENDQNLKSATDGDTQINCGDNLRLLAQPIETNVMSQWPSLEEVSSVVLKPMGFEIYPFHIGWYNELVGPRFFLNYPENTVALVLISGPDAFEKCTIPFLQAQSKETLECPNFDPLDGSMKYVFQVAVKELQNKDFDVEAFHDFDLHPNRKPKVLVQTAAHVAGAVEYFHRDRVKNKSPTWLKDSKLFGVAIHPDHGGWFAIRGVFVLKNLIPDNENALQKPPRPFIGIEEKKIRYLLEEFGTNWKTHIWRDILPRRKSTKYSNEFINYLGTETAKRWDFIKSLPFFIAQ